MNNKLNIILTKIKKLLYLFSASLLVFTSCSKDDSPTNQDAILSKGDNTTNQTITLSENGTETNQNLILPKKIIDLGYPHILTYDKNKIVQFNGEERGLKIVYTYTGDLITKEEWLRHDENVTIEYNYEDNRLKSSVITNISGGKTSKTEIAYTHNADHTVDLYDIDFFMGKETLVYIGKYTFLNGNIVKYEHRSGSVQTYEYDNKNNPNRNILGFDKLIDPELSVNNCIKETSSEQNTSISYEYDYNTNGYPTEKRRLFNGVVDLKTQYFY
ncbi:hypothetical protein B0A75_18565 [Flavobacterium oncorhynchi]|uniref:DUF4595 domain-containing protein n=1 Tax=Flavobacterium oncorhynchi TaxID=728056 RepID=A0A226HQF1_9FLAO|nr:hypothetical protein [Flavobacterium oncorhynchi]OXA95871.1 hypothetical protein B0A75_18565 [Flavobacterium oncorhynchi]